MSIREKVLVVLCGRHTNKVYFDCMKVLFESAGYDACFAVGKNMSDDLRPVDANSALPVTRLMFGEVELFPVDTLSFSLIFWIGSAPCHEFYITNTEVHVIYDHATRNTRAESIEPVPVYIEETIFARLLKDLGLYDITGVDLLRDVGGIPYTGGCKYTFIPMPSTLPETKYTQVVEPDCIALVDNHYRSICTRYPLLVGWEGRWGKREVFHF